MKSYEVMGYCQDGEFQCIACCDGIDTEECDPVFADSEWDCYPVCCVCGEKCEDVNLTNEGIIYEASFKDGIETFYMSKEELLTWFSDQDSVWYELWQDDIDNAEDDEELESIAKNAKGYYYWYCFPGCLPDSDPVGPFSTELEMARDIMDY